MRLHFWDSKENKKDPQLIAARLVLNPQRGTKATDWPERPFVPDVYFQLDKMTEADCLLDFRFELTSIKPQVVALWLSDIIIMSEHDRVTSVEAMCVLLYRIASPNVTTTIWALKTIPVTHLSPLDRRSLHQTKRLATFFHGSSPQKMSISCEAMPQPVHSLRSCPALLTGPELRSIAPDRLTTALTYSMSSTLVTSKYTASGPFRTASKCMMHALIIEYDWLLRRPWVHVLPLTSKRHSSKCIHAGPLLTNRIISWCECES